MAGPANPDLCALRARIQALEAGRRGGRFLPLGLAPLDAALPGGGLALGALHEIMGTGPDEEDGAVPAAFAASLLARLPGGATGGLVLWCLQADDLYAPGLAANFLAPERLIVARCRDDAETLWAMEEGLRSAVPVAVLGELATLSPTSGRRLQLACEASGVTALVLRRWREAGLASRQRTAPSAAVTRWRVAAVPSRETGEPGMGTLLWRVELLRCRGGASGAWLVEEGLVSEGLKDIEVREERDATDHVALAAGLADRPAAARRARAG